LPIDTGTNKQASAAAVFTGSAEGELFYRTRK